MAGSACRTAVRVLPNHHLMSVNVAGPKARSQIRSNSARAGAASITSTSEPSHVPVCTQRCRDVVQEPSLGPRMMSPRTDSAVSTRGASGVAPPQRFPGAGSNVPASSGSAARISALLAWPCSCRWRRIAVHAVSSQRAPSVASPDFSTSAISRRRSFSATRSLAPGCSAPSVAAGASHRVRRIANCFTSERRWYSSVSRSATANPGTRAHSDRYGVAGSVACQPTTVAVSSGIGGTSRPALRKCRRASRFRRSATVKERTPQAFPDSLSASDRIEDRISSSRSAAAF